MSNETDAFLKRVKADFEAMRRDEDLDVQLLRDRCPHSKCIPQFDAEAVKALDEYEVRKCYPCFDGTCPDCGGLVICYASYEHYIMGDW